MKRLDIATSIDQLIGNTPILQLRLQKSTAQLYLKLEKFNPGQSMKDRMALSMLNDAERRGLKKGGTIIESSSGNTASGLAMLAAARGYKFIAVVDHHASIEKIAAIKAYGAEIVYVGGDKGEAEVAVVEREKKAAALSRQIPNSVFMHQADNLANRAGYVHTLAKEILDQLGAVDVLFGSAGTGGSLSGTAEGLKQKLPKLTVVAVEPEGSTLFNGKPGPYYQSGTGNPEEAPIPANLRYDLIDDNMFTSDVEAFTTCHFIAQKIGVLLGGSGGGVLYQAIRYAAGPKAKGQKIVVIIPDGGEKYVSNVFNDEWVKERHLISQKVYDNLRRIVQCP